MVAGTLARAGWFPGARPYPPREANPKGFFESPDVNGVNELLLARALPPRPRFGPWQRWLAEMPIGVAVTSAPDVDARIRRLVARAPWAFKDPRFCYTLPAWRPHVGGAALVCVFRDPAVTAASIVRECERADYLRGLEMDAGRALEVWSCMYRRVLDDPAARGALFLHYDQVTTAPGLDALERHVEGRVDRSFPDWALARSRPAHVPLGAGVRAIYAELCERAGWSPGERVSVPTPWVGEPALSVVVDAGDDGTLAALERADAPPGGFEVIAAGAAEAVHRARGARVAFLGPGARPTRGWLRGHALASGVVVGATAFDADTVVTRWLGRRDAPGAAGGLPWSAFRLDNASLPADVLRGAGGPVEGARALAARLESAGHGLALSPAAEVRVAAPGLDELAAARRAHWRGVARSGAAPSWALELDREACEAWLDEQRASLGDQERAARGLAQVELGSLGAGPALETALERWGAVLLDRLDAIWAREAWVEVETVAVASGARGAGR